MSHSMGYIIGTNFPDIHKDQQNEEYSHATVQAHRKDRFGLKLPKRTS